MTDLTTITTMLEQDVPLEDLLKYLEDKEKTPEICKLVVEQNPNAILYVPDPFTLYPTLNETTQAALAGVWHDLATSPDSIPYGWLMKLPQYYEIEVSNLPDDVDVFSFEGLEYAVKVAEKEKERRELLVNELLKKFQEMFENDSSPVVRTSFARQKKIVEIHRIIFEDEWASEQLKESGYNHFFTETEFLPDPEYRTEYNDPRKNLVTKIRENLKEITLTLLNESMCEAQPEESLKAEELRKLVEEAKEKMVKEEILSELITETALKAIWEHFKYYYPLRFLLVVRDIKSITNEAGINEEELDIFVDDCIEIVLEYFESKHEELADTYYDFDSEPIFTSSYERWAERIKYEVFCSLFRNSEITDISEITERDIEKLRDSIKQLLEYEQAVSKSFKAVRHLSDYLDY